jgi:hypothetical protein
MPKRKVQEKPHLTPKDVNKEFEEKLETYDAKTLIEAVDSFEHSLGWELFKSFVYYQASVHGTMSNVLIQQTNRTMEACAAGAKAEVLREMMDQFMTQLKNKIVGESGVVDSVVDSYSQV